jgi:hypothetical protein
MTEFRYLPTGKQARGGLTGLFGLAALAAAGIGAYYFFVRPWHTRWGATDEELAERYPGDELVPDPKISTTHAITIRAPSAEVWKWLVQIGQGRGGFYSYEVVENAMGAGIRNTDRILPEFQELKVGDTVPLAQGGFGIPVAQVDPGQTLVLHGDTRVAGAGEPVPVKPGEYLNVVWSWHLRPIDAATTRLVERWRADYTDTLSNRLMWGFGIEAGAFIMQRKMLQGIKERAEKQARLIQRTHG